MGVRRRSVRIKIVLLILVPVLSLAGLYAFVTALTAGDALRLASARTVRDDTGAPAGRLAAQIGAERQLAVVYLAVPTARNLALLHAQERRTDAARAAFSAAVRAPSVSAAASPAERQATAALLRQAQNLPALRSAIAGSAITRPEAINAYAGLITAAAAVLNQAILQQTNVPLATQALAFVRMGKSQEYLLQENALLTGDILARYFPAADRLKFAGLAGARRGLFTQTLADLAPRFRRDYLAAVSPGAQAALAGLENKVIASSQRRAAPVSLPAWQAAAGSVAAGMSRAGLRASAQLTRQAQPAARAADRRLIVVGGLGLLAVIVSAALSAWIGRGLLRELARLRQGALDLAERQLPALMAGIEAGQEADPAALAPPMEPGLDEFGQVREAFNALQRAAVDAAAQEARMRRGVSVVFRNLARRSQSLVHRQLALLDAMERRAADPAELDGLYRIDHLTTRMRRAAESLIVLAGEAPGRGWREPVPMVDVLRAAVAEVEDYTRIGVSTGTPASLDGPAAADVIHLLAELAENATVFSPPHTPVRIHGDIVGRGYAVEIEDRGVGIVADELAAINARLADPPEFDLTGREQLGLFVAGRLARRHDIAISLRLSPFGGVTAIVLIPAALITPAGADQPGLAAGWPASRVLAGAGRAAAPAQPALVAAGPAAAAPGSGQEARDEGQAALPIRVRRASLAPQSRGPGAAEGEGGCAGRPLAAGDARAIMAALQQGWRQGRDRPAGPPGGPAARPDGAEPREPDQDS